MIYRLAQIGERGAAIDIATTFELVSGDLVVVGFPFGSRGWFKYGSEEEFTVISVDPSSGEVNAVDEDDRPTIFPGGTRAELEARLAQETSFFGIAVYRPGLGPPGPLTIARGLGLPSSYEEIPVYAWGDLAIGDHVLIGQATGVPILLRVEDDDPELIISRVIGSESERAKPGDLMYFEAASQILAPDAAYRGPAVPEGFLWGALAAAAAGAAVIILS